MPAVASPPFFAALQTFKQNNSPIANGKLNTYLAGTTTPATTYKDSGGTISNSNPIIFNASGQVADAVYLVQGQLYKFVVTNASNVVLGTWDNVGDLVNANYYPATPQEIAATVVPSNYLYTPGTILRYGNNIGSNMASAAQASLYGAGFCYFPAGTYNIDSTVNVGPGQAIYGDRATAVTITTSMTSINTFKWDGPGAIDARGPIIHDLTIKSYEPIVINNLNTTLQDAAGDSPCLNAQLYNLILSPVTNATGTGITASKMFDSEIRNNLIQNYANGIVMNGCDINEVAENRITFFKVFGILEQSGQTFGSQNSIHHNDILSASDTSATFIKSTSRHVALFDNYLEQPSGTISVFIDVTLPGSPARGSNTQNPALSIVIRDNRIDGESFATNVYKLDPSNAVSIICDNRNTSGVPGTSVFSGAVKPIYNNFHRRNIRIRGNSWGEWNGYDSTTTNSSDARGFLIDGRNIPAFIYKDQTLDLVIRGATIVIPVGFGTGNLGWLVPGGVIPDNNFFASGKTYTATVIARTTSSSNDTLVIAMGSNTHGDSNNTVSLTNQFTKFSWSFTGRARTGFDFMGVHIGRSTANGDIEILSISWEQQ